MKNQTHRNLLVRSSLALALALVIWSPVQAQAAEPAKGKMMMEGRKMDGKMMEGKMMERCEEMKEQRGKMMAEMKTQEAELTAQVAKMNSAPDNRKLGQMAAVVTRMAEQRTAMNARMETMHSGMMGHMMQHMEMGKKDTMAQCPMMKGMGAMDEKSDGAHKMHRKERK
jgi:hypothetical protein